MKRTFSLIAFLIVFLVFAQVSDRTASLIKPLKKLKSFSILDEEKIRDIEEQLYKEADIKELYFLAEKGSNAYIKAIAINVLSEKDNSKLLDIFNKHIYSEEKIVRTTSCLSSDYLLSTHIFEAILNRSKLSEDDKENLKRRMLFDVLDHKPVNRELLEAISVDAPKSEEMYSKLRKHVVEMRSDVLLAIIAGYKKPQDIELIKSFGKDAYFAIEAFPDPQFLPFMKEHVKDSKDFPFMFALSNFCSEEAKEIVIKAIEHHKKENLKNDCGNACLSTIYQQVYKEKCTLYYPLLANLWLTDKIISFDILEYYERTHTKKEVERFLSEGFLKPGEAEIIAFNEYDLDDNLDNLTDELTFDPTLRLIKLLEKTKKISDTLYDRAVRNSLENIDGLYLDSFISELKDNSVILNNKDVLIERVKVNKKINDLRFMIKGIEILNDTDLYNKCINIIIQRKNDFLGKEAKEYEEFLEDHKLK